jgi:hypothetical protein
VVAVAAERLTAYLLAGNKKILAILPFLSFSPLLRSFWEGWEGAGGRAEEANFRLQEDRDVE